MAAHPIKGLESEAIPVYYVLANQRLGKQCYPSMQYSQTLPIKSLQKLRKIRRERVETSLVP